MWKQLLAHKAFQMSYPVLQALVDKAQCNTLRSTTSEPRRHTLQPRHKEAIFRNVDTPLGWILNVAHEAGVSLKISLLSLFL